MRISIRSATALCALGALFGCTEAGGGLVRPEPHAAAAPRTPCLPAGNDCPGAAALAPASFEPASAAPMKPANPPVPNSPIQGNCAKLPNQIERDTCTNRKESTG